MAIYLHFLDRELNSSINAKFNPTALKNVLLSLILGTNQNLYCSLSLIFEIGVNDLSLFELLFLLIKREILYPISHHATFFEFIESRKILYAHDAARYPMYFQEDYLNKVDAIPILHKKISTTKYLYEKINCYAQNKELIIENTNFSEFINKSAVYYALNSGLQSIEQKALTFSAFKPCFPKNKSDSDLYFLRRLISESYSFHYIDYLKADIVTGIPKYSYYDYLSTNFPMHDFHLLYLFYNILVLKLSIYQKRNLPKTIIGIRGSVSHYNFISIIKKIIQVSFKRILTTTENLSKFIVIDQLRDFIYKNFIISLNESIKNLNNIENILPKFTNDLNFNFKKICDIDPIFRQKSHEFYIEDLNVMKTILIATATKLESEILFKTAKQKKLSPLTKNHSTFSSVYLGVINNCAIYFVQSQMGSTGPGGSALTINDAIVELNPNCVISLGMAFGAFRNKQNIGDVLVSSHVRCYEPERVGSSNVIPRGNRIPASPTLINRCNIAKLTWKTTTVHIGLILSGEKLVDNSKFKQKLLKLEPEAIGGEMEGAGISDACYRRNIPWIIIKGICDWAENKESKKQKLASSHAIDFFWHILDENG